MVNGCVGYKLKERGWLEEEGRLGELFIHIQPEKRGIGYIMIVPLSFASIASLHFCSGKLFEVPSSQPSLKMVSK